MFNVCDTCAVGVVNGDDSVWDDFSEDDLASVEASIEAMDWVAPISVDDIGCFSCFVCDQVSYGKAHTFDHA